MNLGFEGIAEVLRLLNRDLVPKFLQGRFQFCNVGPGRIVGYGHGLLVKGNGEVLYAFLESHIVIYLLYAVLAMY